MYDEPNINNFFPEIDHDALREYAEQMSKIDEKTPLKTALSICGVHSQNPDPKLVKHQLPEKPIIQDEFSFIPDSTVTNVLNNPVFESQSATKEVVHLNLENTTNVSTNTFSPYDEIQKRLENLTHEQKEQFQKLLNVNFDKAIKLLTNAPTETSANLKFNTGKPTGAIPTSAPHGTDKNLNQPTVQPSQHTIIANKIQEVIDYINKQPELFLDVRYYLTQAIQTAKGQALDQGSGQPYYWNYIADTIPIGKNAVLVSVNGYQQEALLCYNTRTLFIVDNKLIKLKDPQTYSRTVWRYVHQCIDEHSSFWVYNTNITPLSHDQRKSHLLAFYQKNMYKNRWK